MTKRFPNGTWCGALLPVAVLGMPYALIRYAIDRRRERRALATAPYSREADRG